MKHSVMTATESPNALDKSIRFIIGVTAVLLGILLVVRKSGEPALFGRYTVEYAALLLAYMPLLLSALLFAVHGGRVVAVMRPVLSMRPFQLGLALFLVVLATLAVRYVRLGYGIDTIRIVAASFFLSAYILYGLRVAGRSGINELRSSLTNLSLLIGSILLLSLVITVYFSLRGNWEGDVVTRESYRIAKELRRKPNAEFVFHGQPGRIPEFSTPIRNNSFGFNDRERAIENREGRFRIVVLGDSYVAALQVPQGRSFSAVLEEMLNEVDDRFEVIPLAEHGIGQEEEAKILEEFGLRFGPDLVILLFVTNDLHDNDQRLKEDFGKYVRNWHPLPHPPRALFFPNLLIDRLLTARLHTLLARYGYLIDDKLRTETIRPDFWAFINPPPPKIRDAMKKTEGLLDSIVEKCRSYGAHFLLVMKPQLLTRESFLRSHPGLWKLDLDINSLTRWLREYSESRSVSYLDPEPYIRAHLDAGGEPISWKHDGHWNEIGHRLAAEAIYKYLVESDLLN